MKLILFIYWIMYEYTHFRVIRESYSLWHYIHKCFKFYRSKPDWYEYTRIMHASQRNYIKNVNNAAYKEGYKLGESVADGAIKNLQEENRKLYEENISLQEENISLKTLTDRSL